jgi:hypothetical protein
MLRAGPAWGEGGGMAYSTINIRGDGGNQQAAREEADSVVVVLVRWCHRGTEGSGTGDVFSEFAKGESEKMMLLKGQRQFRCLREIRGDTKNELWIVSRWPLKSVGVYLCMIKLQIIKGKDTGIHIHMP